MLSRVGTIVSCCVCALLGRAEPASGQDAPLPLRSEFLMQMSAELEDSQMLGETPLGGRRIVYVRHGQFSGPKLNGSVLPGGGDWVLLRKDGVSQLDVRITLRTADSALIFVTYRGLSTMAPEVRQRIIDGAVVDPSEYYFRITPTFETSAPRYAWLNTLVAVGVGRRTRTGVAYSIHAIK